MTGDYNIEWIFEKIFKQLTANFKIFYEDTAENIYNRTFENNYLAEIISTTTKINLIEIKKKLNSESFKNYILSIGLTNKLHIAAISKDIVEFEKLIKYGYEIDFDLHKLICINNITIFDKYLDFDKHGLNKILIETCAEFGNIHHYMILKKWTVAYRSLFEKAAAGGCLDIIKDVSAHVILNDCVVDAIFKTNKNDAIKFIINEMLETGYNVNSEILSYPVMNCNFEILDYCSKFELFKFKSELFYSAILSKSMGMVDYIKEKIVIPGDKLAPLNKNILLLNETCYMKNNRKYFSHTMNYATQSDSIEMINYLFKLNYSITTSNIITAITQSSAKSLNVLCKNYTSKLPKHVLLYFSHVSFVKDKYKKLDVLIENNLIDFEMQINRKLKNYNIKKVHFDLIKESSTKHIYDQDYLFTNYIFFDEDTDIYFSVELRFYIYKNDFEKIKMLIYRNPILLQTITDITFLYGEIGIISQVLKLTNIAPSTQIVAEIMCRNQIQKLCLTIGLGLIKDYNYLSKIAYLLGGYNLQTVFKKTTFVATLNDAIISKNENTVKRWISCNTNKINKWADAMAVLSSNNINIVKLFDFDDKLKLHNNEKIKKYTESMYFLKNNLMI